MLEELGVNPVNNKLRLQLVSHSIFLNHVNFILQIKKQQKKIRTIGTINSLLYFPNYLYNKKKGFTCHNNPKPVFVWGECVHTHTHTLVHSLTHTHLCFMWLYLLVSSVLVLPPRRRKSIVALSTAYGSKIKQQKNKRGLIYRTVCRVEGTEQITPWSTPRHERRRSSPSDSFGLVGLTETNNDVCTITKTDKNQKEEKTWCSEVRGHGIYWICATSRWRSSEVSY